MDEKSKKASPKWQRAIKTTEWLVSQMPEESQYQIYTFNSIAKSISNDDGVWKNTKDKSSLDSSIKKLKNTEAKLLLKHVRPHNYFFKSYVGFYQKKS